MSDLIRKSSLIYQLQHWREKLTQEYGENDEYVRCLDSVLDVYISDAPTIDAVEVVRCEKCKHYTNYENYTYKKLGFWWCNKFGNITKPDDFCSYGERKEADK